MQRLQAVQDLFTDEALVSKLSLHIDGPLIEKAREATERGLKKADAKTLQPLTELTQATEKLLTSTHVPSFVRSEQFGQHAVSVLTAADVNVEDVLYDEDALMGFMQFLDEQGAGLLVQFWLLADNFASTFDEVSSKQRSDDALGIYNRFLSMEAPEPLGVDESTRVAVEASICREDGIQASCFAAVEHLCYTALRLHFFPRFKLSDIYMRLIKDFMARQAEPAAGSVPAEGVDDVSVAPEGEDTALKNSNKYSHGIYTLGTITEWGEFLRDAEVAEEPSMQLDTARIPVASRMQKALGRDLHEEMLVALQVSRMVINEVLREMEERGTLYMPPLDIQGPGATTTTAESVA
ncbi:uncharacterized protein MONBRDRAFT_33740 [Monosiga brevicollis MX1]|uniref:RGS domain-containing protein n=1 Tax=Monosiga brevicollis TaxID=81824 RepID=A9V770_MONBE|nr:uncharacterized protein MONBRDRAFT_33740 [Monosiga brevicollis MX1]EDQ86669.1 predicted protein [Monosiga brevicollis MX1]|eukprot:XP_001748505.1 hypothetical protein [Monosiga brevicollis MX1]